MLSYWLRLHKWITLVAGLFLLGWVLGGLVMTAIPIGVVRGENHDPRPPAASLPIAEVLPLAEQVRRAQAEGVTSAELRSTPRGPIWFLNSPIEGESWWDAVTGENVQPIDRATAERFARAAYLGPAKLVRLTYFAEAPAEAQIGGSAWQVVFDDWEHTRLYVDSFTGETLSRRSAVWRVYDFFYQIHILNFGSSRSYNHPLIIGAAAVALAAVLTGFFLLAMRLSADLRRGRR